jgi:hypothetical protein
MEKIHHGITAVTRAVVSHRKVHVEENVLLKHGRINLPGADFAAG